MSHVRLVYSRYHDKSPSIVDSNPPLSTTVSLKPSNDQHSKISRHFLTPSRLTSKDWSVLTLRDQTMSSDRSRYQSIQSRSRNPSTLTSYSRSKDRTTSNNSPIFSFLQTPTAANNHIENNNLVRVAPHHSTHNTSPSHLGELRQWISELYVGVYCMRDHVIHVISIAKTVTIVTEEI